MTIQNRVLSFVLCATAFTDAANIARAADDEADRWHLSIETDEGRGTSNKGVDLIFQGLLLGLQVRW